MSVPHAGALLVTELAAGAALMPRLAQCRGDLQWRLVTSLEQAVFEVCAGDAALAVFDGDCLEPGFESMLIPAMRCAPATRMLVHARNPGAAAHAATAACGWLELVSTDALPAVLRNAS